MQSAVEKIERAEAREVVRCQRAAVDREGGARRVADFGRPATLTVPPASMASVPAPPLTRSAPPMARLLAFHVLPARIQGACLYL